jgi:alanyl-tRNA synthetase
MRRSPVPMLASPVILTEPICPVAATGRFVAVLAGELGGPAILVAASRDLVGEGFDAAAIVREVAPMIGGGGGGRAELAQAGGKDLAGLDRALREGARLALEALQRIENG